MNLPELRRARAEWLTKPRLVIGAVAVTGIAAAKAALSDGQALGSSLADLVLWLQAAILFLYGVPAVVRDFAEEQEKNTWDLLRLTPLSPGELVLGKLLAASSYALYLAALLVPWGLLALPLDRAPSLLELGRSWLWLALSWGATSSTALAAAAVGARLQGGRLGVAGLALGGLGFALFSVGQEALKRGELWYLATAALWLAWSTVGARVQVGRLLSLRAPRWALPGFIVTVWGYFLLMRPVMAPAGGGSSGLEAACLLMPGLAAILASLAEPERPADWSLRKPPGWTTAWVTVLAACLHTMAVSPADSRLALVVPLFLARDLLVISYARLVAARAAEAWAMGALGALYLIPGFFALATRNVSGLHWLVPMGAPEVSVLANVAPAVFHAAAAGLLVWAGLRERRKGYALASPESEPAA